MKKFRKFHLIKILEEFDSSALPLDLFLNKYFRAHKAIGSKDRKEICETVYLLVRWKGLLDFYCEKPISWEKRFSIYESNSLKDLAKNKDLPSHIQVSFPKEFFNRVLTPFGKEKTTAYCLTSNSQAPVTIRVNTLKTSRADLLQKLTKNYEVVACKHSDLGITFKNRINFHEVEEFKNGFFEVQDEGSQIVASYVKAKPGDHVLDYCAGSGGKTLAFAPNLREKGQVYLYDIRNHALAQAKKRLKRAGIQNVQFLTRDKLKKKGFQKRMDWILLDVPCSGTGTIRRNPDMKWRFDPKAVERLVGIQRDIFEQAIKYLSPDGYIVYATCSILPEENYEQISYFMKTYNMKLAEMPFFTFPQKGGMDGFFAAVLKKA